MRVPLSALLMVLVPLGAAGAEHWSAGQLAGLPDSAFAAIEVALDGRRVRHLPHHDQTGAVDPVHLRAALARLGQVRWLDPASEAAARRHLEEHRRELGWR
ncbi:MAG TPA: hypothetical protein VFL90_11790 [Methylomirabilota bacterium]|nr:hypothetical protein [Methylomirabilota bacterium]